MADEIKNEDLINGEKQAAENTEAVIIDSGDLPEGEVPGSIEVLRSEFEKRSTKEKSEAEERAVSGELRVKSHGGIEEDLAVARQAGEDLRNGTLQAEWKFTSINEGQQGKTVAAATVSPEVSALIPEESKKENSAEATEAQWENSDQSKERFERLDSSRRYMDILNEESLNFLKTSDPENFFSRYSGELSPRGYLLDKSGKETNFLPSQNIGGGDLNAKKYPKNLPEQQFADYLFVSPDVNVISFKVPNILVSDHLPLILDFS